MCIHRSFPGGSTGKESACNAEDPDSNPGSGRPPGEGGGYTLQDSWASLVAQLVKNLPAVCSHTAVRSLGSIPGLGRSPGARNGNLLQYSWRISWTEEPGGLQPMRSQRVGHD